MLEPGGEILTKEQVDAATLRAELCHIAHRHSFQHGHKIVDDILAVYSLTRKPFKEEDAA